jgi:hypothetical protein
LIAFAEDHIANYKKLKSLDCLGEFLKRNYGKMLKGELRAKYWEEMEGKD